MLSKRYRLKLATWIVVRVRRVREDAGIEILDHVIVGNGTGHWLSFRDMGLLGGG